MGDLVLVVLVDISERKRVEERQRLLIWSSLPQRPQFDAAGNRQGAVLDRVSGQQKPYRPSAITETIRTLIAPTPWLAGAELCLAKGERAWRNLNHRVQNLFAVVQSMALHSLDGKRSLMDAREVFYRPAPVARPVY